MVQTKIKSFIAYIKSIGLVATIDYIFQRYISGKEMIVLNVPGVKEKIHLRKNSKDVNVFQQIFIKQDLAFLKGRDYRICIDAGANIGLSAIYMKNQFPGAAVFCIEPESSNVEMLRLNTIGYTNITIIAKALGEDSGGVYLVDPGNGSDSFQTSKQSVDNETAIKIESISMKDLILQYKLDQFDFVKMDIEGAEANCISEEAMGWITQSKLLAIEIHEHLVPGCTKKIDELLKMNFKYSQNGEYSLFENVAIPH